MRSDVERLAADLQDDPRLRMEAESLGTDPEELVEWARAKGYEFSLAELTAHVEEQAAELSDEDLGEVSGGWAAVGARKYAAAAVFANWERVLPVNRRIR